jgi:CHAT domain-containing protein
MNEARRQAYLNLIDSLLTRPRGEEDQILKANFELVDAELVQVMLKRANDLRTDYYLDDANYLITLAEHLSGRSNTRIEKSSVSAYAKFLIKVVQVTAESKGDRNVIHPLLRDNVKLLDDGFANVLQDFGRKFLLDSHDQERHFFIAKVYVGFSNAIADFSLGSKMSNLEIAIAGYKVALTVFTRQEYPEIWAENQNNLARAYFYRIRGEKAENLEMALAAPQEVLSVITREGCPFEWARSHNNLGSVYIDRIRGEKAENLEMALAASQAALSVYTSEAFPFEWAIAKNNLAVAYRNRITGEKADNLERAISAINAVLSVITRERCPFEWARSQHNLGAAYSDRIRGEKAENIDMGIAACNEALSVYTREAFPQEWAKTKNNLASYYRERIRGEKAENLEMAIITSQEVLSVITREEFSFEWARIHNNLANVYTDRIKGEKAENLEMAIAASQAALSVYTREALPQEYALTQNSLGNAYRDRIRGEKAENLEMAIAAYQAALCVFTREVFPQEWANTKNNLAIAYRNRIRGEKAYNIEMAIAAYNESLLVYTSEAFPLEWAMIKNNLGNAYKNRIRREKADNIEMAIAAFNESLLVYTNNKFPFEWARSKNNLGTAYWDRIKGEKAENIEMAIAAYNEALLVYKYETFPLEWSRTKNNLGNAYNIRIKGEKAENIEMAIAAHEATLKVRTPERFPFEWANTKVNLAAIYTTIIMGEKAENIKRSIEQVLNLQIAIVFYKEALSVYTRKAFPIHHTRTLLALGVAYRYNFQLLEAYNTFNAAIETVESMRRDIIIGGEGDRQKLAEEWNQLYQQMVEVCLEMENKTAALEYVERSKTRNLIELFHNARSLPGNLQRQPISFAEIRSLLAKNEAILEWYITFNGFKVFIITRDSIQPDVWESSLEDLQALEEFQEEYIDDIKDEQKYDNWTNQLETRLEKLAQILQIDEIISRIPEHCQQLILVPFRYLHLLPLHALTSRRLRQNIEETGCLLDLFPGGVRYTPSCQLLQLSQRVNPTGEESSPTTLFAIQNPTEDLDFTDIEVEAIAKSFNPAEVLIREKASKTGLQQQLEALQNADIAHFSCHGFFDFLDPRKSALILAGAKISTDNIDSENKSYIRSPQDELLDIEKCLTLEEIFDLPLSKCSLVTLSACETGLTDIRDSTDEYIGLPSGFLYAGTTNVISTLWAVNDVSTAILMIKFYEIFLSETRPAVAVALRESQLWLRDATVQDLVDWVAGCKLISDERKEEMQNSIEFGKRPESKRYKSPHFWAAFCAIGQ